MRKVRKWLFLTAVASGMALFLTACGAGKFSEASADAVSGSGFVTNSSSQSASMAMENGALMPEEAADTAYAGESISGETLGEGVKAADSSRKLIKTVYLHVETREFDLLMDSLERQVENLGGYIESMETYNGSRYSGYSRSRTADLVIRIPQGELNGFLDTVSESGNVISRSESVEDVTLAYVDMESRKNSLQIEQERLLSFLEQAESIEDIIVIEERLSQVRYQLESMESQLRTYDNQVDYSTVHLSLEEVRELTPVEEKNAWQRMADGFLESVKSLLHNFSEAGIWFVVNLPFLAVWVVVILVCVFVGKRLIRRLRRKKEKRSTKEEQPEKSQEGDSSAVK
ncbi:MAG: DUF4349 domain-containing protein [Candidatus Gastranaerophilales bacterium]|nr:DUF4349 domain-containing protein [Candidatus Gastranaerophilales bacterium]